MSRCRRISVALAIARISFSSASPVPWRSLSSSRSVCGVVRSGVSRGTEPFSWDTNHEWNTWSYRSRSSGPEQSVDLPAQ